MFGFFKKKRKSKDDRIQDFIKDLRKVYGYHQQWLSPKEMQVLSKNRTTALHWIRNCSGDVLDFMRRAFYD